MDTIATSLRIFSDTFFEHLSERLLSRFLGPKAPFWTPFASLFGTSLGMGGLSDFCDPSFTKTQFWVPRVTRFRTCFANVCPDRFRSAFLCVFGRLLSIWGSLWGPSGVILGTFWHLFGRLVFESIFDGFWAGVGGVGGPPGNLLSEVSGQNWPEPVNSLITPSHPALQGGGV